MVQSPQLPQNASSCVVENQKSTNHTNSNFINNQASNIISSSEIVANVIVNNNSNNFNQNNNQTVIISKERAFLESVQRSLALHNSSKFQCQHSSDIEQLAHAASQTKEYWVQRLESKYFLFILCFFSFDVLTKDFLVLSHTNLILSFWNLAYFEFLFYFLVFSVLLEVLLVI